MRPGRAPGTRARTAGVAGVALLTVVLSACVGPARNSDNYHGDASAAVKSGLSEALTAHLVIGQWLDRHATGEYADVVLTDSETAMGPIQDSFGSRQPDSPQDDDLRDTVLRILGDEQDALAHARIAVRRSDVTGLRQADADIADSIDSLDKAQASLG
jgi:hypothetical protein